MPRSMKIGLTIKPLSLDDHLINRRNSPKKNVTNVIIKCRTTTSVTLAIFLPLPPLDTKKIIFSKIYQQAF